MEDRTCPICFAKVSSDLKVYTSHGYTHVIELLKHDHPDWVEENGACDKCYEYYVAEINGTVFKDAPCAIRIRFGKKVLRSIKKFFIKGSVPSQN